jgi:hypothetical protein
MPSKECSKEFFGCSAYVANSGGIPAGILKFRSDSLILPPELRNIYMKVPDFSGVCSLCHSREPAVLHDPPTAKRA